MLGAEGAVRINRRAESAALVRISFLCLLLGLVAGPAPAPAKPVRVLILSGQNNHDWKSTTPKLKAILEEGGQFEAVVTEKPDRLTARALEPNNVILSNWNAFGLESISLRLAS